MARWRIVYHSDHVSLVYTNLQTGEMYNNGACQLSTPDDMILAWILDNNEWTHGDWIFSDRTSKVLRFAMEQGEA